MTQGTLKPVEEHAPEPSKDPEADVRMTIWEHLSELRGRLLRSAIALVICACVAWAFRVRILDWLQKPYENAVNKAQLATGGTGQLPELQTLAPTDVFVGYLQLSLIAGCVAAAPVIFYQLWAFISPGLYRKEKRLIFPFVFFSTTLFLSGVAFAYYVALPFSLNYFLSLLGPVSASDHGTILTHRPTLEYYLDFTTRMLLAFGFVFELPLFISFLVIGGIVTPRQLLKFSRWAIVLAFILGAVVTPGPEISSQIAVSGALIGLYFLSLAIAFVLRPRKKDEAKPAAKP